MRKKVNETSALIAASALAAVSMASLSGVSAAEGDVAAEMEKCYGVVKAGANDCAGAGHACAGHAATDADGTEFLMLPVGTCDKLAGGSTTSS